MLASEDRRRRRAAAQAPRQGLLASIDVFEQDIVVSRYLDRDRIERRYATPAQCVALLDRAATADARAGGAWWPVQAGVVAVALAGEQQTWLVLRPAGVARVRVAVGKRVRRYIVQCPPLLAELAGRCRSAGKGVAWEKTLRVWAVGGRVDLRHRQSGPLLAADTPLYAAPFPNLSAGGRGCLCGVNMGPLAGKPPLEAFESAWFGSLFTDSGLEGPLTTAARKRWPNILRYYAARGGHIRLSDLRQETTYGQITGQTKK